MNKSSSYGNSYNYFDIQKTQSFITKSITSDIKKLTKNSLKNKDKVGSISKHLNYGFIDSSNVHSNYIDSCIQNQYIRNTI